MNSMNKDLKANIYTLPALALTALTAAGSGDNTAIEGTSIDLTALPTHAQSVCFVLLAKATLTADKTLVVTGKVQYSSNGTDWTDAASAATLITITATGSASARLGFDLTKGSKYVRVYVTPDLSASGTDTASVWGAAVFGGLTEVPQ